MLVSTQQTNNRNSDDEDDGDETFNMSAFNTDDDNNFYKLLNVNANATQQEIREAYKRRAREFHPDKNADNTTRIFQAMKSAYETLCNERRRMEYDANTIFENDNDEEDDDDMFSTATNDQMRLNMGAKLSDVYKQHIDRYINEFDKLFFSNNFNEKMKEIIDKVIKNDTINPSVDNYIECNVCHQSSDNKQVHMRENREPYEKMFEAPTSSLSLEKIIGSDIWNWKAMERTSMYSQIWNAREKWKQIPYLIPSLEESIEIISKPERYWTLVIDQYEQEKKDLFELHIVLTQTKLINYLPDSNEIQNLKLIFDKYNQEENQSLISVIQQNDQRIESGYYYLIDPKIKNKYIDKNDFYLPITNPPEEILGNQCCDCRKKFSLFTRRHHCRMCGQQYCADCLIFKRIPHLGFIAKPVRICHKCSDEREHFIYEQIFIYVKKLIQLNRLEYLNIYLALLYQYKTDGNEQFYRKIGENFFLNEDYSLAIQCFTYANMSNTEWFAYSIDFYKKKLYSYCFTCMTLCKNPDDFWLNQDRSEQNIPYILLCYERIKLPIARIFEIACEKFSTNDISTCLSYLVYLNLKYLGQINWKEFGEGILLNTKYDGSLAMLCFQLYEKMQINDWHYIAEKLLEKNQYEKLAYLLVYMKQIQQIDLRTSKNNLIYFLTKILLSNTTIILLDDWLNDICNTSSSFDMNRIIIGLSIAYVYKYRSWVRYKNQYVENKQYSLALICHKMAEFLNENNDTRWLLQGIEDEKSMAYELFDNINNTSDWKQLGDQYFNNEKYQIALNCYLFCDINQIYQIILQQARSPKSPLSVALLYFTIVYKHIHGTNQKILSKNNTPLSNNTFHNICTVLSEQNNPHVLELVRSAVKMYETDNRFENKDLFKYHLIILKELEKLNDQEGKNDRLINGGLHILLSFNNLFDISVSDLHSLNEPLLTKSKAKVFNELKSSTYESCLKLMITLLDPKNYFLEQLKELLQQCLGRLKLTEIQPLEYRSKMYFIQAIIYKLENNPIQSLSSAHNALLSHPYDIVMTSLILFMNHSYFHSTIRQSLIKDIKDNSLNLSDITPPKQIMNLNFLRKSELLTLLKKYERSVVKKLADNNPIQAAYSYIDLSMATSGGLMPFILSVVTSCLYFYQAMTDSTCKTAELYAYRSIIFDISVEMFVFTRHYLPLYIQMYIYKLLYTIILRSTELFADQISIMFEKQKVGGVLIIKDTHEIILDELLTNILQISKVSPLTHTPSTSTVYDLIYMDYAGSEFLAKYFKFMSTSNSMYQYYYFEGVWKGWIDNEKFIDQRENCMQALLYDHDWIMNDVEDLLYWPLIPRTSDGWLLNTKHRLQFEQQAYTQVIGVTLNNDTGDIELMLTQSKKTEHNLFDATDIMEVLTNGITFAYFTLDPPSIDYHSHPFNEMRYIPKRLSETPNYLFTLLHTDYLLKMISTGVEICSFQPFKMRSITENLMQRLPVHIREELQAISLNKSGTVTDNIHRFWIQPEPTIEYEQAIYKGFFGKTNENIVQYYLNDDIKMCVKQHRMKYDETGNLIDDENDTKDDQSSEAQFARIFTKYYDIIGEYFPELLRLKELLKLSILSRFIQARYQSQIDFVTEFENDRGLEIHLTELRRRIGRYPTASRESDEKIVNSMATSLSKQFFCKKSEVKSHIISWLTYGKDQALTKYAKQSFIQEKAKLKFTIEKLNLFHDDSNDANETMTSDFSKCSWVPAAFSNDLSKKVYGGVALNTNVKETFGIKTKQEKTKSIIKENLTKLFATVNKQKLKKESGNPQKDAITIRESFATKIFGTRQGHVPDTSQNRKMLERVANDQSARLGKDKYDNTWYAKTLPNGKQVWVQIRKDIIRNGGLNDTPMEYNPVTGLTVLAKPNQNVKIDESSKIVSKPQEAIGGTGRKPPSDGESPNTEKSGKPSTSFKPGRSTESRTRSEAERKILQLHGLPHGAKLAFESLENDKNLARIESAKAQAKTTGDYSNYSSKVTIKAYEHPDGYYLLLRRDNARLYNEKQPKGSNNTTDLQRAYFNVYRWWLKSGEEEDTQEYHFFSVED